MSAEQHDQPVTIDAEPAEARAVDPPPEARREKVYRTLLWATEDKRRPIVPAWARSREDAAAGARFLARHGAHVTAYHATRSPKYAARLVGRAPAGLVRLVLLTLRWEWDAEGAPLRRQAVEKMDFDNYMKLTKERNARVRTRTAVLAAVCGALIASCVALYALAPRWAAALAVVAAVGVLGVLGTPGDRRVLDTVVNSTGAPVRLTANMVETALTSLGIAGITAAAKTGKPCTFPAPITRDGAGWRADVDLPAGVVPGDVLDRRDQLASALRRPAGAVWPEAAPSIHAGRLVIWVGDVSMADAKPAPWPLAKSSAPAVDLFAPVPFALDQRGRTIGMTLIESNLLIGSLPGAGKTMALRLPLLAAALDPTCEIRAHELKGSGDLEPLAAVAHRYGSGPDDETIADTLASIREVHRDLERRAATIKRLPKALAPENKTSRGLASRRDLGLHPLVLAIDECQELFSHKDHGKEAGELCTDIIKRGRAFGVVLLLATQRPDKESLPTGISANIGIRFCLRVMGQVENDLILGTSSYRNGLRATMFTAKDRGIGYLRGHADDPAVGRTFYVDGPTAEKVAERARAVREAEGRLSGYAAGERAATDDGTTLLDDLATVWVRCERTDRDRAWSDELCELLAEHRPALYAGWTPKALAAALEPLGIDTFPLHGRDAEGVNRTRRGVWAEHLDAALEARGGRRRALGEAPDGGA